MPRPHPPAGWLAALLAVAGCGAPAADHRSPAPPPASTPKAPAIANPVIPQEPSPFRFAEVARESGVDFNHVSGMNDERHFPTANGSGGAMFDADGDGKLDLYFATLTYLPVGSKKTGPNRFYRNLGGGKFREATAASGLGFEGFCHGVVVGDVDNDGDQDVYLCNYGPNVLFLNNGDGTFRDVTHAAGMDLPAESWSSGGAWIDYDNDGDLDLYVARYGEWLLARDNLGCSPAGQTFRQYCSPKNVKTVKHLFYRNDKGPDGVPRFTNVYDEIFRDDKGDKVPGRADGHGFAAVSTDVDGDGKIDLYVTNDQNPNFLFLNRGDGTFLDTKESSGASLNYNGATQSGMGIEAEDVDGDGRPDLLATNFQGEGITLFQNLGGGLFLDQTPSFGLAADSLNYVGWGCSLGDFDNDGWPDCFVTNGHVDNNHHLTGANIPYEEPATLHRNVPLDDSPTASRRFRLATRDAGPYFDAKHVGRGLAWGDYNDDGKLDLMVNHKDGPPALLRNDTPEGPNRWVRLKLVGTKSNRDAIGAKIEVEPVAGGRTISRQRRGGTGLMSAHDPRVLVGVGPVAEVAKITVRWPSGAVQTLEHVKTGATIEVREP